MKASEVKKFKKIKLPSSCSLCSKVDSEYWYAVLSCLTPTEIKNYDTEDLLPVVGGVSHYVLCEDCSKRYNAQPPEYQIFIRKNLMKKAKCNCSCGMSLDAE